MSVFQLANDHPLTKAGLRRVQIVEEAEVGLRPGDIVFEFAFGRIVDTGMACRRDGIIPPGIDLMTIHKEATATTGSLHLARSRTDSRERLTFQAGGRGIGHCTQGRRPVPRLPQGSHRPARLRRTRRGS